MPQLGWSGIFGTSLDNMSDDWWLIAYVIVRDDIPFVTRGGTVIQLIQPIQLDRRHLLVVDVMMGDEACDTTRYTAYLHSNTNYLFVVVI